MQTWQFRTPAQQAFFMIDTHALPAISLDDAMSVMLPEQKKVCYIHQCVSDVHILPKTARNGHITLVLVSNLVMFVVVIYPGERHL